MDLQLSTLGGSPSRSTSSNQRFRSPRGFRSCPRRGLDNIEDVVNPGANSLRVGLDVCMRRVERARMGLRPRWRCPGVAHGLGRQPRFARQELITLKTRSLRLRRLHPSNPFERSRQPLASWHPRRCRGLQICCLVRSGREGIRTKGSKAEITTTQLRRAAMGGEIREFAHSRMGGRKRYHYLIIEVCKSPTFSSFAALLQKADTEGFVAKGRRGTKQRKPRLRESPSPD